MENRTDAPHTFVPLDLPPFVTPPRRGTMPVRNKTAARAAREPYTLKATRPSGGSRGLPRQRCVSTEPMVVKEPLIPNLDSTISATDATTEGSKSNKSRNFQSDTPILNDSAISASDECQIKSRLPVSSFQSAPAVLTVRDGKSANEATIARPKQRGKSKSDPLKRADPTSESNPLQLDMDKNIIHWLTKPLTNSQCQDQELGNNYIFETVIKESDGKTVVKIGCTKGPERTRLRNIRNLCKHFRMKRQDDPEHLPIRLYKRAEKLIQAELSDFQYLFACQCEKETSHTEYFDIDKTVALEAVQRWREFCKREPYDKKQGKLRPFWHHRLTALGLYGDLGMECDYEWRVKRWRQFMNPSAAESFWYDFDRVSKTLKEDKWRVIAFVEALAIATLTYPNFYTFIFFASISLWIFVEMMGFEEPITPAVFFWKKNMKGPDFSETSTINTDSREKSPEPPRFTILDDDEDEHHGEDNGQNDADSLSEDESFREEEIESPDISLVEDAGSKVSEQEVERCNIIPELSC